jgi:Zinc finger, C2H2 type
MPRARTPQAVKSTVTAKSTEFVCPECGRTFTRAASLGAHRRGAHKIPGATSKAAAQSEKSSTTASTTKTARRRRARTGKRAAAPAIRTNSASNGATNRDALLQTLFPSGIPAKESVIRSVNRWLDEAERLARLR